MICYLKGLRESALKYKYKCKKYSLLGGATHW